MAQRPGAGPRREEVRQLEAQLALAEADLQASQERATWSERMVKKGFLDDEKANAEKAAKVADDHLKAGAELAARMGGRTELSPQPLPAA